MNFPEALVPSLSLRLGRSWLTYRSTFDNGGGIRRAARLRDLYAATLTWKNVDAPDLANLAVLEDFVAQMQGGFGSFTFTDFYGADTNPIGRQWPRVFVHISDGASTGPFDLPSKSLNITTEILYAGAAPLVRTTDYTISAGAGTDGKDRLNYVAGRVPANGTVVRLTGFCRRSMTAVANDLMDFENTELLLVTTGLTIQEIP
jgi:hypothetical protein